MAVEEGSVAELLDDSYARFGYCKGSLVSEVHLGIQANRAEKSKSLE